MQEHTENYVASQQGGGLSGGVTGIDGQTGEIDFATLIGTAQQTGREIPKDKPQGADPFGLDEFDTLTSRSTTPLPLASSALTPSHTGIGSQAASSSFATVTPVMLSNATSLPTAKRPGLSPANSSILTPPPTNRLPTLSSPPSSSSIAKPLPPPGNKAAAPSWSSAPLAPSSNGAASSPATSTPSYMTGGSNYNLNLSSSSNSLSKPMSKGLGAPPLPPLQPSGTTFGSSTPSAALKPTQPHGWGSVLTPSKVPGKTNANDSNAWADFDPLK